MCVTSGGLFDVTPFPVVNVRKYWTKCKLVINLKTAKALSLTVPASLMS